MNADADPYVGKTIAGRYTVSKRIGEGGMGTVYLATQQPLGRQVALKVLRKQHVDEQNATLRFESEAHAVSRLNHPNIVTIYDFGSTDDGTLYIAMEYIAGQSLYDVLKQGPLPVPKVQFLVEGIARALAEAHAHGIVHRDLKPENIMLYETATEGLTLKVLDFGIAKMKGTTEGRQLTEQDLIIGTPGYMSPEQINGEEVDARADLYALGIIWWEALIGRPLFEADSPVKVLVRHISEPVPAPSTVATLDGWSKPAEALLLSLVQKSAAARPTDGEDLVRRMRALESDEWAVLSAGSVERLSPEAQATVPPPKTAQASAEELDDFFGGGNAPPPSAPAAAAPPNFNNQATVAQAAQSLAPPEPSPDTHAFDDAAPALGDGASADRSMFGAPSADLSATAAEPPPATSSTEGEEFDPEFSSLGGGSSAYSMMMADIYGGDGDGDDAPSAIPGGTPFTLEKPSEPAPVSALVWRVEIDGIMRDNVPLVEVRELIKAGRLGPKSLGAPQGRPLAALISYAPFRSAFKARTLELQLEQAQVRAQTSGPTASAPAKTAAPTRAIGARAPRRTPWVAAVGALVLAGGAYYLIQVEPDLGRSLWARVMSATGFVAEKVVEKTTDLPLLLDAHADRWQKDLGEDARSVDELFAAAERRLEDPTPANRNQADELYRRALIVDRRSPRVTGAFVENVALMRGGRVHLTRLNGAELLQDSEARFDGTTDVRVQRAKGAMFLVDGRPRSALAPLSAAVAIAPDDGSAQRLYAEALLEMGQVQDAIRAVTRAKKARPNDTLVDMTVAKVARERLMLGDAQASVARRKRTDEDDPHARALEILLNLDRSRPDDVRVRARAACDQAPADDKLRVFAARVLARDLDDRTGALELLRRAPSLESEESADQRGRADLLALRAVLGFAAGHGGRARADLARARKVDATSPLLNLAEGRVALFGGKGTEAVALLQAAEAEATGMPIEATVKVDLANAMVAESKGKKSTTVTLTAAEAALRLYREAIALEPLHTAAHLGRLTMLLELGRLTAESSEFDDILSLPSPTLVERHPFALPYEPRVLSSYRRRAVAHRARKDAVVQDLTLALIAYHRSRIGVAETHLRKVLRKDKRQRVASITSAAISLGKGKPKRAIRRLNRLDEAGPLPVVALLLLSQAESMTGETEEASVHLASAMTKHPPSALLTETEAVLIEARDGKEAAREAWRSVLEISPGHDRARARLLKTAKKKNREP